MQKRVTPETILSYIAPTPAYLCPLSANIYQIQFLSFKIRDAETNQVFFAIEKEEGEEELKPEELAQFNEDDLRTVRYYFGKNNTLYLICSIQNAGLSFFPFSSLHHSMKII